MTTMQIIKPAAAVATIALVGFGASSLTSLRADSSQTDSRIQIGLNIAPVKLNLNGLDPAEVGVGSYIINAQGDCNTCHLDPFQGAEFSQDPTFIGVAGVVNAAAYLGGGVNFGTGGILINPPVKIGSKIDSGCNVMGLEMFR